MKQVNSVEQTQESVNQQNDSQEKKSAEQVAVGQVLLKQGNPCNVLGVKEEEQCFLRGYN